MVSNWKNFNRPAFGIAVTVTLLSAPARAYEAGMPGAEQKPGITLGGASAGVPAPGIYMFDQFTTYQASISGPHVAGYDDKTSAVAAGFLFVPGWNFLGATYDAVVVLPFYMAALAAPVNYQTAGMHNSYIAPVELSWKLGDSGFFVKTGLGIYVPDGTITGPAGLSSIGDPWWTFQPELIVSYLKDGWNLTANVFEEFHTKNPISGYQTGDIFHAEFTATKTIGNWTFGPVGYLAAQVTNDTSSAYYNYVINSNQSSRIGAGGLIGYNFGRAQLNFWLTDEVYYSVSGKSPVAGVDLASVPHGASGFLQLSYRLWAPDDQQQKPAKIPLITK
jgi:hypothetical protein